MAFTSKTFKIAEAVKTGIETLFPGEFTIVIKPDGVVKVKESDNYEIFIIPSASIYEIDTRKGLSSELEIALVLTKYMGESIDAAGIDVPTKKLEDIIKALFNYEFTVDSETFLPMLIENDESFDSEVLFSDQVYFGMIAITFKVNQV